MPNVPKQKDHKAFLTMNQRKQILDSYVELTLVENTDLIVSGTSGSEVEPKEKKKTKQLSITDFTVKSVMPQNTFSSKK